MTRNEIKTLHRNGNSTWEVLHMVVDSGVEYPDAVWIVSQALGMDCEEREDMERDYLECC